ncbi:MAG: Cof-type HAD-IIB family hydrolase [Lachnospiraceae bacterium]|nr:Cof-type HAD-IIB family hydrolase [Lachnospiraceae bacterium]
MKIFFTDLDGTLLDSSKRIGGRTRTALERFLHAGNALAISTGRAMESAMAVRRELELFYPRTFLIAYNGAQIYDCDREETIYRIGIDKTLIDPMFSLARRHRIHIHTYNDTHIVSPPVRDAADEECLTFYRHAIKSPILLTEDIVSALPEPPCKCIAIELHDAARLERFRTELSDLLGDAYTLLYSNPWYLEIFRAEAGKGSAVYRLCEHLGIPLSDAIAAGDEENDISMIRAAGLGIAMKNGSPHARAAADIVTEEDNDHDGLAEILTGEISD